MDDTGVDQIRIVRLRNHVQSPVGSPILSILIFSLSIASGACSRGETGTHTNIVSTESFKATSLQKMPGNTAYSVDRINNQGVTQSALVMVNSANTPSIIIAGWAVDVQTRALAGGVNVTIDGKSEMTAIYGAERPDVATALKEPNYKLSGFAVAIPTNSLEKGKHTIGLKIVTSDKKGYYEPPQRFDIEIQ
jgi:hypothetical protein